MRGAELSLVDVTDPVFAEAARTLYVCNACRYCEGVCATFQAMTGFRSFAAADLDYLANLCHNCSACLYDCQYAAPHDFDINVPAVLADVRLHSYERYAWPAFAGRGFHRNAIVLSVVCALAMAALLVLGHLLVAPERLLAVHLGPGAFYEVVSHEAMLWVAGGAFAFALLACAMSCRAFVRGTAHDHTRRTGDITQTLKDAVTLKNLDGGHGQGCHVQDDAPSNARRYLHHVTVVGFMLCLASTVTATVYHYGLGLPAPYAWDSLPVVLGTVGGVGLVVGPLGLLWIKRQTDRRITTRPHQRMDVAFLTLLLLVSSSGLVLLAARETVLMGWLLLLHLGFVLTFFVVLPYSKFVHGIYRVAALLTFHRSTRTS